ncbi:hypothetical protein K501DRAFT_332240 [Backusella circina FSU 941]|nr:hypothetical protein K501DRAFT_332240 [Backusella circina FSU 941]
MNMDFEDIVDMDWVNANTTDDKPFSSEFYTEQDILLEQPIDLQQQQQQQQQVKMETPLVMPTTEQIKQLIEMAKRQLALREQEEQTIETSMLTTPSDTTTQNTTATPVSSLFSLPQTMVTPNNTTIAPESLSMPSPTTTVDEDMEMKPTGGRRDSLASVPEESISLEAYAEADGIDLKKLTPKERRQLRNKISARNFRVRRKEYISTLEGQVNDHKQAAEVLKEKLNKVEEENKVLRKEMDILKRQNQLLQQTTAPSSPRITKPNLNKDISMLGTKPTDSYRQDHYILVSNAVMPVWDYNSILASQRPQNDEFHTLAGAFLLSVIQMANQLDEMPPLMPDERDFSNKVKSNASSSSYIEYLYDTLIQDSLISKENKSFWWWDNKQAQAI